MLNTTTNTLVFGLFHIYIRLHYLRTGLSVCKQRVRVMTMLFKKRIFTTEAVTHRLVEDGHTNSIQYFRIAENDVLGGLLFRVCLHNPAKASAIAGHWHT